MTATYQPIVPEVGHSDAFYGDQWYLAFKARNGIPVSSSRYQNVDSFLGLLAVLMNVVICVQISLTRTKNRGLGLLDRPNFDTSSWALELNATFSVANYR